MTKQRKHIKVTYSTLGSPDPLLHEYFEEDVAELKNNLGKTYKLYINGQWVDGDGTFENRSPINTDWLLGSFARASAEQVDKAVAAAKAAFPGLARHPLARTHGPGQPLRQPDQRAPLRDIRRRQHGGGQESPGSDRRC